MSLSFDPENPVVEVSHWMSLLLGSAKGIIDERFGDGFAAKHPDLIAAYLQASASMMNAKTVSSSLGDVAGAINEVVFAIDRAEFFSTSETK